jgi:hypothetical protein
MKKLILILFITFIGCEKEEPLVRCWKVKSAQGVHWADADNYIPVSIHSNWCCNIRTGNKHEGGMGCAMHPNDPYAQHNPADPSSEDPCYEEEWDNY